MFYSLSIYFIFFFFNVTATTEIYTLSLHDALPIYRSRGSGESYTFGFFRCGRRCLPGPCVLWPGPAARSEEHTSELQSRENLVCRLLLEKKKKNRQKQYPSS